MRFAGKVIERQMRAEVDCLSRLKDLFEAGPEKDGEASPEATEAEEAEWWDAHMDMLENELLKAMQDGTAQVLTRDRLAEKETLN